MKQRTFLVKEPYGYAKIILLENDKYQQLLNIVIDYK